MPTALPRGLTRFAPALLGLVLLALAPRPAAAQEIMTSMSAKHMESILSSMDIDFEKKNDHTWKFKLDGHTTLLFLLNDNTDAQLYVAFGDITVTPNKMNDWNKSKRFARAYADDDKNPVLESDLDFTGGVTDDIVKAWIKLFPTLTKSYLKFLQD